MTSTQVAEMWAKSRSSRQACSEPIRAIGLIIAIIFAFYPSITAVYGVSVGLSLLIAAAFLKLTRGAWIIVAG